MPSKKDTRNKILNAAEDVVIENGAAHMTLDAVCAKAGISKGGLLYHFSSKDALLEAMIDRLNDQIDLRREEALMKQPEGPARQLKAHILSSPFQDQRTGRVAAAILAAIAHKPKLLKSARMYYERVIARITASELPTAFSKAIVFAANGLSLGEMLGFATLSDKEHEEITSELLRLVNIEEARLCAASQD